jgi:YbbR domain-containing protein
MVGDLSSVWRAIRNNGRLKIIAIVLAALAWFVVRGITSHTAVVREVRVSVLLDEGWAVLDRSVEEVDVICRGSQSDIRYLTRDQIRVEVDLRGRSVPGTTEVPLRPQAIKVSGGARAIAVEPPELTLTLDREGDRMVKVKAEFVGNPPEGYELAEVVTTPTEVRLQGPQGRLAAVTEVKTVPIDLEGRLKSFSLTRALQPPSELWSAKVDPDRVRVDVRIVERSSAIDLADIPIRLLVLPETPPIHLSLGEAALKLSLRGRADAVKGLSASTVNAYVDCTVLKPGESRELPVVVNVPSGVEIVAQEPTHILVEWP